MTIYTEPAFPALFRLDQKDLRVFDRDLITVLGDWNENIKAILDRGISFPDNMDVRFVTFTSNASPDTEDEIAHELGKIPLYMQTVSLDKGAVVYRSGTTWTKTSIFVKTNTASTAVVLMIF